MDFDEYIVASGPHKRERAEAWKVVIGLQAADGQQDNRRRTTEGSYEGHRRIIKGTLNKSNCGKCDFWRRYWSKNVIF